MCDVPDKRNVPALRFSEFTDEWENTTLKNECSINPTSDKLKDEFVYVDLESVEKGELTKKQVIEKENAPSRAQRVLQNGDVLFQCVRPYQKNNYLVKNVSSEVQWVASTGYAQLRTERNNPAFIYHLLNTSSFNKKVIVRCTGSSYPAISNDDLSKIHFYICGDIEEQKRIADFLTLLDERIATQNKIIEKLESLIRGIVTKICSGAFVKGEYVFLRDILIERHIKNTENYEVYSVSVSQGIINQIDYLGRSFAAKETLHYNVVNYGDIVYTKSPTGDFPYGIVKRSHIQKPVAVSPLYGVYQPKNDYIGKYLHLYFKSPINTKNYLHRLIQKGAKNTINITNSHFLDSNVFIPEKTELINIVNLTSVIEDKLILASRMLDSLKSQKGYLLSKIFI